MKTCPRCNNENITETACSTLARVKECAYPFGIHAHFICQHCGYKWIDSLQENSEQTFQRPQPTPASSGYLSSLKMGSMWLGIFLLLSFLFWPFFIIVAFFLFSLPFFGIGSIQGICPWCQKALWNKITSNGQFDCPHCYYTISVIKTPDGLFLVPV